MKATNSVKLMAVLLVMTLALSALLVMTPAAEENTEAAYIADGLVAWYDGVDNEANGTHNNDATVWQNKVNATAEWAINLTVDDADKFTDEGFAVHDTRQFFPTSVLNVINSNAWTLEVSLGEFVGLGNSFHTFINCDNDNFSLFIRVSDGNLEFKYAGLPGDTRPKIPDGVNLIRNSIVTISYEVSGKLELYVDGVQLDSRNINNAMGADNLFFGHDRTDRNQDTTFKAIRIYDRALNEREIAYNYAVATGTADGPYEAPETEAPTEPATEAPTEPATEIPTEPATEVPTEPTTEVPTEPATEVPTEEPSATPTEAETDPVSAPATDTTAEDTTAPADKGGCGSVIGFGAVATLAVICGAVLSLKKGKDA